MTDLAVEPQTSSLYSGAPPISDEAMDAKRKALETLVAEPDRNRLPVPNHLLQSSMTISPRHLGTDDFCSRTLR